MKEEARWCCCRFSCLLNITNGGSMLTTVFTIRQSQDEAGLVGGCGGQSQGQTHPQLKLEDGQSHRQDEDSTAVPHLHLYETQNTTGAEREGGSVDNNLHT